MKKIITIIAFLALSSVSAKAVSLPDLGFFSLTAGVSHNQSVWGATATEQSHDESDVFTARNKASGVFTDNFGTTLVELGLGKYISVGYESTQDPIQTPENVSREGDTTPNRVSATFNDLNTTYLTLNIPGGAYLKYGTLETDVDIKSTVSSGNVYKGKFEIKGETVGVGYRTHFKDTGFGIRFETNYSSLDDIATNNGVVTGSAANGGKNLIDVSNLEGVTAKVALTYTLSRNN